MNLTTMRALWRRASSLRWSKWVLTTRKDSSVHLSRRSAQVAIRLCEVPHGLNSNPRRGRSGVGESQNVPPSSRVKRRVE